MKLRTLFIACFCCWAGFVAGQISFSPAVANFSAVFQGVPSTTTVTLNNNSATDLVVEDIDFFHTDAFSLVDTSFIIAPNGSRTLTISCDPHHNINYADWMLVKSSSHPEVPNVRVYAIGKYTNPYYDATQNLWNEALKQALKTTITTGMVLNNSYNQSRDQMYMVIDNQRVNGQGAAVNTLECIYTGFIAAGYTSRTDAQNTFGLNTEHTMPQSLFSSNLPELSDLHHIFVTTGASNSERANKPFGVVTNPSWTQGGSKSNSTTFEPRDEQKGASLRALLYFYFRYQDYQGFICNMEPILRAWNATYLPDSVDRKRNDDVFAFQDNRNPFVDHPEFLDRIASLCTVDNGNQDPVADWIGDTLDFGVIPTGNTRDGFYAVANQGINTLNLSSLTLSDPVFSFTGATTFAIAADSLSEIQIRFAPTTANQNYLATLTFTTDDPTAASRTVYLKGSSFITAATDPVVFGALKVWPQPAHGRVWVEMPTDLRKETTVEIWNLQGQLLRTTVVAKGSRVQEVSLNGLPAGGYLLRIENAKGTFTQKLIVE